MSVSLEKIVSISEFNKGRAGRIFADVARLDEIVVMKNNRAQAVVVSPRRWKEISEQLEDAADLALARERLRRSDLEKCLSREQVLAEAGLTQADINAAEDPEIE